MKIRLICALLSLVCIFSLVSCSNSDYKNDVSSKELSDAIVEAIASPQGFTAPDSDFVEFNMEGAAALCEDYSIMLSSININMNEFGVFHAKSEKDAESVAAICQSYIDLKIEGYNPHYLPQEYPKIQNAKVKVYGSYVVYTVLTDEDTAKVDSIFTEKLTK